MLKIVRISYGYNEPSHTDIYSAHIDGLPDGQRFYKDPTRGWYINFPKREPDKTDAGWYQWNRKGRAFHFTESWEVTEEEAIASCMVTDTTERGRPEWEPLVTRLEIQRAACAVHHHNH